MRKLTQILHWAHYIWILVLPVYSVLYFTLAPESASTFSSSEKEFLASCYFLVGLLNLFLASLWTKKMPATLKGTLLNIGWPIFWIGVERLLVPFSFMAYLASLGLVYVMSLALWFTTFLLVTVYRNPKEWWAAALQLLFVIPALGSTYVFGKFLWVHEIQIHTQGKPWLLATHGIVFLLAILTPASKNLNL